jgi:hypothetical protein
MRIVKLELRKIALQPSIWLFLTACLAFNIFLVAGQYSPLEYKTKSTPMWLAGGMVDVFNVYDTAQIARGYIENGYSESKDSTGKTTEVDSDGESVVTPRFIVPLLEWKYQMLQTAVDRKAAADEAFTPYFGEYTVERHRELFVDFLPALGIEGIIIAMLIMFQSLDGEGKTEELIASTKTRRRIVRYKLMASFLSALAAWAALATVSVVVCLVANDYGGVWESSISSAWNMSLAGDRPFITWQSFSVLGYLLAVLGVQAALLLLFALMAYSVWLLIHNAYTGFTIIGLGGFAVFVLCRYFRALRFLLFETPIMLWNREKFWFTDGDCFIVLPNFELWGIALNAVLLMLLSILALRRYQRRNLV